MEFFSDECFCVLQSLLEVSDHFGGASQGYSVIYADTYGYRNTGTAASRSGMCSGFVTFPF